MSAGSVDPGELTILLSGTAQFKLRENVDSQWDCPALAREPRFHHRIFKNDGLIAFGSGRDEADLDADTIGKEANVLLGLRGEFIEFCYTKSLAHPAGQRFVNRLDGT